MGLGLAREVEQARRELGQHALARHRLVARMQRRELDRDARPGGKRVVAGRRSDRVDRRRIGFEIARRVVRGARALAEHVERVAELAVSAGARERLLDGLAHDEMRAEKPHGLPRRGPHRRPAEAPGEVLEDGLRGFAGLHDAGRDAERPRRRRHQERARFGLVMRPVGSGELVLDQLVGGGRIRHPQQRFRQHHQGEALLGGERILAQEILDAAERARVGADRPDQRAGARVDAALAAGVAGRIEEEAPRDLLVRRRVRRSEWRCTRQG